MKNLLFTGGAGYIGSHTIYQFLKNTQFNITIIDNLSTGFAQTIDFLKQKFGTRVEFIKEDLANINSLDEILKNTKFEAVVHFGASIVVGESVLDPLLYYSNNTINTTNLIKLCIKNNIKNFIFSSTAAVYGQPSINPISEDTPTMPINPYGTSKLMSELILRDSSNAYDFNYIALRYFNVAGASIDSQDKKLGQLSKNATHLIKVATQTASGKRDFMEIYGDDYPTADGTCIRDYIHVDDLANAHLHAFEYLQKHQKSNIFNVGYSNGYSVKEVIDMVKKVSGVDFEVRISPRRDGDPAQLVSQNKKILSSTLWKPRYNDLELICKSAYEWERSI